MARPPSAGHTEDICELQPPEEDNAVEPQPKQGMDRDDQNPSACLEQAPSHGVGLQRRLSWLCHTRGLDHPSGQPAPYLAPRMVAAAAHAAPCHPYGLDGHRAGRSRAVCRLVVSAYRPLRLAPLLAHQRRRDVSSHRLHPAYQLENEARVNLRCESPLCSYRHLLLMDHYCSFILVSKIWGALHGKPASNT